MTEQLREDLEALYEYIKLGWCGAHHSVSLDGTELREWVRHGEYSHGCLITGMQDVTRTMSWDDPRIITMIQALGFEGRHEMFRWNDTEGRPWEEVLDRVKTAIGEH